MIGTSVLAWYNLLLTMRGKNRCRRLLSSSTIHRRHLKTVLTLRLPAKGNSQGQPIKNPASGELVWEMQSIIARAKQCMLVEEQRQKRYYDMHHKL